MAKQILFVKSEKTCGTHLARKKGYNFSSFLFFWLSQLNTRRSTHKHIEANVGFKNMPRLCERLLPWYSSPGGQGSAVTGGCPRVCTLGWQFPGRCRLSSTWWWFQRVRRKFVMTTLLPSRRWIFSSSKVLANRGLQGMKNSRADSFTTPPELKPDFLTRAFVLVLRDFSSIICSYSNSQDYTGISSADWD